ncbi:MAG: phosphonate metabolism protein/1,5-bisphosphokinase (PRPP-forming) PhnN [Gammaproteobacteria bacterium]
MTPLIYLIGASGVGKDSLLNYLRDHPQRNGRFSVTMRYITRPETNCSEAHIELSQETFADYLDDGRFVMNWDSHGFRYGIGREIKEQLEQGIAVVVNGSRAYLPTASERFENLIPVLVSVPAETLRHRLEARGRDSAEQIEKRLQRAIELDEGLHHPRLIRLDNDGPLEQAGEQLLELIRRSQESSLTPLSLGERGRG